MAEKIVKFEIKLVVNKTLSPSFNKNLEKIVRKTFEGSLGKSLMGGTTFVGLTELKK